MMPPDFLRWRRVYLGNAGSDYGGIGHIRAFDAKTGNRLAYQPNIIDVKYEIIG
jgi:hypothetical protein